MYEPKFSSRNVKVQQIFKKMVYCSKDSFNMDNCELKCVNTSPVFVCVLFGLFGQKLKPLSPACDQQNARLTCLACAQPVRGNPS